MDRFPFETEDTTGVLKTKLDIINGRSMNSFLPFFRNESCLQMEQDRGKIISFYCE